MKIGIFGGSFDPVHYGHLWIAEHGRESLELDHVIWIPASTSPLKRHGPVASDESRLAMLRLALGGSSHDIIDDREIRRGDISYTVDTLAELRNEIDRDDELYLMIGSDSLATIPKWHQPKRLCEQAVIAVVQRGGDTEVNFNVLAPFASPKRIKQCVESVITMPQIELSSTEIRARAGQGESIRYRLPRSVEAYLNANTIYSRDNPSD